MRRFFVPMDSLQGEQVVISGSDAHHLVHVLRKKVGDCFEATDGQSQTLLLKIVRLDKDKIICQIVEMLPCEERRITIRLFQAFPKNFAWENILSCACELGVAEIIPFLSERTVYASDFVGSKKERWERIIKETAKKTGRTSRLILSPVVRWETIPTLLCSQSLKILPWENEKTRTLRYILERYSFSKVIDVMIGSEGGFSLREVEEACQWGFLPVSLGNRILTTSTAVTVTLANIYFSLEG